MWNKVRKFGLEHCDLPTTVGNMEALMRIVALNIDARKKGSIIFIVLTLITVLAYAYVYVVSMIWFVFWRETEDPVVDMVIFSLGVAALMSVTKLFCLQLNSKRVRETITAYLLCDSRISRDSRMYRNLLKSMRVVKRRALSVWILLITNALVYIFIRPAVLPGKHLIEDGQVLYGLEPMLESPNFELALVIVSAAVLLSVYAAANVSCLLIIIAGYIEAQMTALSDELLHLWTDAQALTFEDHQTNERQLRNQYIKHQLENIVQAHTANLHLLRLAERVFSNSIAIEFLLLVTGLIAELLGGLENTYLQIPYALTQVSMDCFTGQRLLDASLRFREAVYGCKWENFDVSNMRTVLVILQNSQPMVLSAGGVAELRFTSLMAILKSIFSAYTALRSTVNK